ncbi:hypothetical protein HK100_005769, partial [Physocladia obscura]
MNKKLDNLLNDLTLTLDEFTGNGAAAPPPPRSVRNHSTAYSLEEDMVEFLESFGDDDINGFGNSPTNISLVAAISDPLNQSNERVIENTGSAADVDELAHALDDQSLVTADSAVLMTKESTAEQQQSKDPDSATKLAADRSNDDHLENINVVPDETTFVETHIETLDETIQEIRVTETAETNISESITTSEISVVENAHVVAISKAVSKRQTEEIAPDVPKILEDEIVQIISEDLVPEAELFQLSQQQNVLESTNVVLNKDIAVETQEIIAECSTVTINQIETLTVAETVQVARAVDATSQKFVVKDGKHEVVREVPSTQIIALGSESSDDLVIEVSKYEVAQIETTSDFVYEIIDLPQLKNELDTAPTDVEVHKELQQQAMEYFQPAVSEKFESQQKAEVREVQPELQEYTPEFVIFESPQHETLVKSQSTAQIKSQQETAVSDFENYAQVTQETVATIDELLITQSEFQKFTEEFVEVGLQKNETIVKANFSQQNKILEVSVAESQDANTIIEVPITIKDPAPIIETFGSTVTAATAAIEDPSESEEFSPPPVPSKSSSPIPQTVVIGPRSSSVVLRSNETELLTPAKSPSRERALSNSQSEVDLEYNNNHTSASSGTELDNDIQAQITRIKGQIEHTRT